MAFIDEVNAVDLKGLARGKVPRAAVAAVAAGVVAVVIGFVAMGALAAPAVTIQPSDGAEVAGAEEGQAAEDAPGSDAKDSAEDSTGGASDVTSEKAEASASEEVAVHVGGCVAVPGLYRMPAGSRVDDAVKAAGGVTTEGVLDAVNLAAPVDDGMQVIIPSAQQVAEGRLPATSSGGSQGTDVGGSAVASGPLNINTASADEFTTLSGIGEALAKRIVDDREKNGAFSSVDDLTRVSGIGEKKLEGFRDEVCV